MRTPAKILRLTACCLLGFFLAAMWGCSSRRPHYDMSLPAKPRLIKEQEGIASWYGRDFHGKKTSSGEIYNMYDLTAAHKDLPLGSRVLVTNLENGRQVEVVINDRGPFIRGRIIDLSYGAAKALNMVRQGTALVRIKLLAPPPSWNSSSGSSHVYGVQAGSFVDLRNASRLASRLRQYSDKVFLETGACGSISCHRVRAGWFPSRSQAEELARELRQHGFEAIVIQK